MCNPRRVTIRLQRAVEEAWQTTVEQAASASSEVCETAQVDVDIPLDNELGGRALCTLDRLIRGEIEGFDPWTLLDDGSLRRDLDNVSLIYHPGSHRIMVEARLSEVVSAEVKATAEASGFTVGEVAEEAVGHYYHDGWGGRTEDHARQYAEQRVEQKLQDAIDALHLDQHADAIKAAEEEARENAEQEAAAQLEEGRQRVRQALRDSLQVTLQRAEDQVRSTLSQLVGEAYRYTLLELVQEHGGSVLQDRKSGSMIELDLEF